MQIKYATAREMGYNGDAIGLLDPKINLTYAVPYLANAYRLADGDEDRAVTLFSSGYYYTAHQKKMLAGLDASGRVVLRRRMRRSAVGSFVTSLRRCVVAMEACCGAHHSKRTLRKPYNKLALRIRALAKGRAAPRKYGAPF
jgi:hypothetical protein